MNISAAPWSGSPLIPLPEPGTLRRIAASIGFLLLAACASTPPDDSPVYRDNYRLALRALDAWSLQGRLNIRSGNRSDTINIRWQHNGSNFDINLSGTLGLGAVRITGSPAAVFLEKAGEEAQLYASLDEITADTLGYAFPASELVYWVRGIRAPGRPAEITPDSVGFTASLGQRDSHGTRWALQYDRYQAVADVVLPGRIRLEQAPYRLTFLISEWQLPGDDN